MPASSTNFLSINVKGRKLVKSRETCETLDYYNVVLLGGYTKIYSEEFVRAWSQVRHEFANLKTQRQRPSG